MSSSCCDPKPPAAGPEHGHSHHHGADTDYLLWGCALVIAAAVVILLWPQAPALVQSFAHAVVELLTQMWWGVALAVFFVGLLSQIPREFVMSILGRRRGWRGIGRAVLAGLFFDLCSHGILLVGMKLYERGASLGQVMAFLIASPWNSLSLTLVLTALIGLQWTLVFIVLSAVVALVSGLLFEAFEDRGVLPRSPFRVEIPVGFRFWPEASQRLKAVRWNSALLVTTLKLGVRDSRMIVRWLLLGIILAAGVKAFVPADLLQQYFGPTIVGLAFTLFFATIIEVCSEGATPLAAELVTRAGAVGNGFAFLMAGVATDYTEILVLRQTFRSWRVALFLPLVTVPQIIVLGYLLNVFSS